MNLRRISHELKNTSWIMNEEEKQIIVNDRTVFVLPSMYPFKCPTLLIDKHSHVDVLKKRLLTYVDFCKVCHIQLPCICCRSITASWSPCYTCKDIYKEFLFFKKMIHDLYVLSQLYEKNIPDIIIKEISSYLL